jgi:hypothetical protein
MTREAANLFPRAVEKLASWSFTGEFGQNFERLINLQMWCFGCDIRNIEGNLLTEFGFTRTRPPPAMHGSTRYSLVRDSGYSIHLWGFGMIIEDGTAALCLKRFERVPRLSEGPFNPHQIFKPHQLPSFHEPLTFKQQATAKRLLQHLCRELLMYEAHIHQRTLTSYRRRCVNTSPKIARLRGIEHPLGSWEQLGLL